MGKVVLVRLKNFEPPDEFGVPTLDRKNDVIAQRRSQKRTQPGKMVAQPMPCRSDQLYADLIRAGLYLHFCYVQMAEPPNKTDKVPYLFLCFSETKDDFVPVVGGEEKLEALMSGALIDWAMRTLEGSWAACQLWDNDHTICVNVNGAMNLDPKHQLIPIFTCVKPQDMAVGSTKSSSAPPPA
ncbi:hypothetical protein ACFL04_02515 [Patescibacteria group bacterium]